MIIQKKLFLTYTPNLLKRYDVSYIWDLVLDKIAYTIISKEVENQQQLLREHIFSQCRRKSFEQHIIELKKTTESVL